MAAESVSSLGGTLKYASAICPFFGAARSRAWVRPLLIGRDPCASQGGDRSCLMKAEQVKFPLFRCGVIFQRCTCGTICTFSSLPLYPMRRTMLTCFNGIVALYMSVQTFKLTLFL
ncbi:unnamed protein product [Scytosiphon promiscuus]